MIAHPTEHCSLLAPSINHNWRLFQRYFLQFCDDLALPWREATSDVVCDFLCYLAERPVVFDEKNRRTQGPVKPSSLLCAIGALSDLFRRHGLVSPIDASVRGTYRELEDEYGVPVRRAKACTPSLLVSFLSTLKLAKWTERRTRTLSLLLWEAAARQEEMAGLWRPDLRFVPKGLIVTIRTSKTNKTNFSEHVAVRHNPDKEFCAVCVLQLWLDEEGDFDGPVFPVRDPKTHERQQRPVSSGQFCRSVKTMAKRCGQDPTLFSGNSMRRGHVTTAERLRRPHGETMAKTRHKRKKQFLEYVEDRFDFTFDPLSDAGDLGSA
jgi:hypothetical protein